MKKRDIFLDFTSLLDVTLIVIFFFVLFSHLESEENKLHVEETVKEYETLTKEANLKEEKANELIKQLEQEIDIIRNGDERQAENIEAMLEYLASKNLKLVLDLGEEVSVIRVNKGEEVIAKIGLTSDISTQLLRVMKEAGYQREDTIFCDIIYDGISRGSNKAYRNIMDAVDIVKVEYPNMYYSITNISNGKE